MCNTRYCDTLSSGFLDGGQCGLHREVTNASSAGWIHKLREGTIPAGGYVAAGYEQIDVDGLKAVVSATDVVDTFHIVNGQSYCYVVRRGT